MAHTEPALYVEVVRITHVYLGPAADRFITRQIQSHLHKDPDELSRQDLLDLIDWVRLSISVLTDDPAIVEEYIGKLRQLTSDNQPRLGVHHAT